jgi:hypothetical protein
MTSSSLFSLFDRPLPVFFATALAGAPVGLGFALEFADMVARQNEQNKPKVVMVFRHDLDRNKRGEANPCNGQVR